MRSSSNFGVKTNVLIENNLLAGGAYAIYCSIGATGVNYRVINNPFCRRSGQRLLLRTVERLR